MEQQYFQDNWEKNKCFGCGNNTHGLHIKSYWKNDESICIWKPHIHHMAGPSHILNGGIIATIIDCHSICTAIANEYKEEQRALNSSPFIWCVTASLNLDFLAPTPIDKKLKIKAHIRNKEGRKTTIACSIFSDELETVKAELLAIRVNPDNWYK